MSKRLPVYVSLLLALTTLLTPSVGAVYASSIKTPSITSQQAEHEATTLFSIPSYYKLSQEYYDINAAQGQSSYNLVYLYTTPDGSNHYVNVTVSASDGQIMNFSRDSSANGFVYPLPVSAAKAKTIAMTWADRLFKNQVSHVRLLPLMPSSGSLLNPVTYQFNFERVVSGIPAPFDGFSLTIDQNGELIGASDHWTNTVVFPSPSKAVSVAKANQMYQAWTHLYMAYTGNYNNGKSSIALTYQMPTSPNVGWWSTPYGAQYSIGLPTIDALTGRVITSTGAIAKAVPFVVPVVISPNGPTQYPFAKHVTWNRIQALAYAQKVLGITTTYHLTDANLSQSFPNGHSLWTFSWSLAKVGTVNATVDATEGTMQSFWRSFSPKLAPVKNKLTQTRINQVAQAFVAKLFPKDTGGLAVFVPSFENSTKQLATDFTVEPVLHGIAVTGMTGNIQVNSKTGMVQSYWGDFNTSPDAFVSPTKAISTTKATNLWTTDYPLTEIYALPQNSSKNALLLYAPVNGTYGVSSLNAVTGKLITTNMPVAYTGTIKDIAGLQQKAAIALLAQYGLLTVDANGDVHPQTAMTREAFVKLVVDALGLNQPVIYHMASSSMSSSNAGSTSTMGYSEMQAAFNRGWLSHGQLLHPTSLITRGDAAQILARALGYAGVMNHAEIFTLPSKDAASIAKNQIAGDAIAYALGMLPLVNGKFMPNGHVTIADAALAIVRLATAYNEGQQLFSASANAGTAMGAQ